MHAVKTFSAAATGVLLALAGPAAAQNLVQNGGFETGNFTGWTGSSTTDTNSGVDDVVPHSGSYAAFLGSVGTTAALSQTLATTPGQSYTLSFFLQNEGAPISTYTNSFTIMFDGATVDSVSDIGAFAYQQLSYQVVASGASSVLSFVSENDNSYFDLDDVSVDANEMAAAAPEPATWALMILGFGVAGATLRRRRITTRVALA